MGFVLVGGMRVAVSEIRAVQVDGDGRVYLHYGARCDQVVGDEAAVIVAWADANLVGAVVEGEVQLREPATPEPAPAKKGSKK